jgi:hypothetical protein
MKQHLYRLSLCLLILSLVFSLFFLVKIRDQNQLIDKLIDVAVTSKDLNDREQIAISLSSEIYRRTNKGINKDELDLYSRIESTSFFNVSSAVSLKYGAYGITGHSVFGPCGTMSRTLLNALWRQKIPARKLLLIDNEHGKGGGHAMVEFYHNGAWRVLSPSDNTFVWRTEDGEIATAKQIQNIPTIFSQIYIEKPNYPYLFDNYKNIRWEKLPNWITSMIKSVIGEHRFNSMETPKLYDLPRTMFLYCSILSSIFFSIVAYASRSKKPLEEHNA